MVHDGIDLISWQYNIILKTFQKKIHVYVQHS
jgi:hypothetical protein